jgi:hypothetical protein
MISGLVEQLGGRVGNFSFLVRLRLSGHVNRHIWDCWSRITRQTTSHDSISTFPNTRTAASSASFLFLKVFFFFLFVTSVRSVAAVFCIEKDTKSEDILHGRGNIERKNRVLRLPKQGPTPGHRDTDLEKIAMETRPKKKTKKISPLSPTR